MRYICEKPVEMVTDEWHCTFKIHGKKDCTLTLILI